MKLPAPIILIALFGCGSTDARTVDFYSTHDAERATRVRDCVVSGGMSQDCRNAKQAEFQRLGVKAQNGVAIIQ